MNKKWLSLIFLPSAAALFFLLSERGLAALAAACAGGLLLGIGEAAYCRRTALRLRPVPLLISLVSGGLFCYAASRVFCRTWLSSVQGLRTLVTAVCSDYPSGLRALSLLLSAAALPAAAFLVWIVLRFLSRSAQGIDGRALLAQCREGLSLRSIGTCVGVTAALLALSVLLGTVLLTLVYTLPTDRIEQNVKQSAQIIREEGTYPQLTSWATSRLDNWTDSIMLTEAAYDSGASPLEDAMLIPNGYLAVADPAEAIAARYLDGTPYQGVTQYPRYWHGFLVLLKPLLALTDYGVIRLLNGAAQLLLVLAICGLLVRKGLKLAVIPYLISYLMLMPAALAKSLQYSACFYVLSFACLSLLLLSDRKRARHDRTVFLLCGILTAYFDFFTYPIAAFGVPMLLLLLLSGSESVESRLCTILRSAVCWCVGYAGMWISKWILAGALTGENVIADGFGSVMKRTAAASADASALSNLFTCELNNAAAFLHTPVTAAAVLAAVVLVILCLRRSDRSAGSAARVLFPFFLTGLAPIVWYAFASNHSLVHSWFTNKALVVTLLAALWGPVSLLQTAGRTEKAGEESRPPEPGAKGEPGPGAEGVSKRE